MSTAELRDLLDGRTMLMPLTVDQYHTMLETGILRDGDPYELLNGMLVRKDRSAVGEDPMTIGHEHAWAVNSLVDLNSKLKRLGCYMQVQQPLSLPPYDEPEPDGAVIVGTYEDYRGRHPTAADVTCVIEVADASLNRDRTTKLRAYAGSGIAQYVIINLVDRLVEVYTEPMAQRYGRSVTLGLKDRVEFAAAKGKRLAVAVRKLLP